MSAHTHTDTDASASNFQLTVAASTCHPGVFGTVEMKPSIVGTWLVECNIGDYQLAGMRAKLLVYDPRRYKERAKAVESRMSSSQKSSTLVA